MEHIVTLSPKGQITIPATERQFCPYRKYLLKREKNILILKPIKLEVINEGEFDDISKLSEKAFKFWNNSDDDIYGKYYNDKK